MLAARPAALGDGDRPDRRARRADELERRADEEKRRAAVAAELFEVEVLDDRNAAARDEVQVRKQLAAGLRVPLLGLVPRHVVAGGAGDLVVRRPFTAAAAHAGGGEISRRVVPRS